jgi:hypothetical protein
MCVSVPGGGARGGPWGNGLSPEAGGTAARDCRPPPTVITMKPDNSWSHARVFTGLSGDGGGGGGSSLVMAERGQRSGSRCDAAVSHGLAHLLDAVAWSEAASFRAGEGRRVLGGRGVVRSLTVWRAGRGSRERQQSSRAAEPRGSPSPSPLRKRCIYLGHPAAPANGTGGRAAPPVAQVRRCMDCNTGDQHRRRQRESGRRPLPVAATRRPVAASQ